MERKRIASSRENKCATPCEEVARLHKRKTNDPQTQTSQKAIRKPLRKAIKKECRIKGGRSFDPAFAFILSMERFPEYQEATGRQSLIASDGCCQCSGFRKQKRQV